MAWKESLVSEFYPDGLNGLIVTGAVAGNVLTLTLKQASAAATISYLDSKSWSQDRLLDGANGIAALTFCEVPISPAKPAREPKRAKSGKRKVNLMATVPRARTLLYAPAALGSARLELRGSSP